MEKNNEANLSKFSNLHLKESQSQSLLLDPYLRILMFNQSGRLVKKKKTTVAQSTKDPVFNETLNFEVSSHQLDRSVISYFLAQNSHCRL